MIWIKYRTASIFSSLAFGLFSLFLAFFGPWVTNFEAILLILAAIVDFYVLKRALDGDPRFVTKNIGCSWLVILFYVGVLFTMWIILRLNLPPFNQYTYSMQETPDYPATAFATLIPRSHQTQIAQYAQNWPSPTPGPAATRTPSCADWSMITLQDVDKYMCVQGIVNSTYKYEGVYFITFGKQPGDFYLLSYDYRYADLGIGDCVRISGTIEQLGQSPVIAITDSESLLQCP